MKRRSVLSGIAALPVMAATVALGSGRNELPGEKMMTINEKRAALGLKPIENPTVTHPDGKVFVRINDHWMPL